MLRQIVVHTERVSAAVAEELPDRAGRVRADIEKRGWVGCAGGDHNRVLHGARFLKRLYDLRHRRLLLADRAVDAGDALALLVDDRVDRDRRLAGLPIADDELALAAPDGHHAVDRLEPGLQRFLDRLTIDHARREAL